MDRQLLDLERRVRELERVEAGTTGAWIPGFLGSGTAGTFTYDGNFRYGFYTRVGNVVYFSLTLRITAISVAPTGNMSIAGLPFTSRNQTGPSLYGGCTFHLLSNFNATAATIAVQGLIDPNASGIRIIESFDNAAFTDAPAANFTNATCFLIGTGFYFV